jgi:lipopolysaccharide transport system permease protein
MSFEIQVEGEERPAEASGAPSPALARQAETDRPRPRYHTVIEPPSGWPALNLAEVWRYRDLLFMLVWRDISANYRQSVVGFGWALFKPVFSMIVFTLVFGRVAKLPSDGVPYPIFCYAALLPWMYFATCLAGSTNSVVGGSGLLTKVYFPRLILPLASVLGGLVDFGIQFVLLAVLMLAFGVLPGWGILLVPGFVLLCVVTALSVGLWLTALNVKYRDVGHLVPFLSQMWMWLTPIVYPSRMVPERLRLLYGLNPMAGVVEGFRWALLGTPPPDWAMMAVSFAVVTALLLSGLYYFRRTEATFADVI